MKVKITTVDGQPVTISEIGYFENDTIVNVDKETFEKLKNCASLTVDEIKKEKKNED